MLGATSPYERRSLYSPGPRAPDSQDPIAIKDEESTSAKPTEPLTPTAAQQPSRHPESSTEVDRETCGLDVSSDISVEKEQHAIPPHDTILPFLPPHLVSELEAPESRPQHFRRTSLRLRKLFGRSRSSTMEAMQSRSNPQATVGSSGSTLAATAPLSPTPSYSQYIGHSAENSEISLLTKSSVCSDNSSTSSIAEPWHLSKPPENYPKRFPMGLSFKNPNVMFANPQMREHLPSRKRSTSMDNATIAEGDNYISMPAATGAGLKARRLSTSFPADFNVDTVELHNEYASGSILPGRKGKLLGKGSTATVTLMVRKGASADGVFAVKEFRKKGQHENEDEYVKKVKSEYTIAKSLHHPNIVESIRLCTHGGRWSHVMEFCSQGEIFTLVLKNYLTLEDNLCLFKQLLRGIAYMHSQGVAHRDIKLENLLMNDDGHLKITDFGVSDVFCGEHPGLRKGQTVSEKGPDECRLCAPAWCGSLPYMAPEVIDKIGQYDPRAIDVWSCAIVLMSMIHKGNPWPAASRSQPRHQYARFLSGWDKFIDKYPDGLITGSETPACGPLFSNLPKPAIKHLLLRMMHTNPNKRITIYEALEDRFVKGIECCCVEDHEEGAGVDAKERQSWTVAVKRVHHHLPPRESRLPSGMLQKA